MRRVGGGNALRRFRMRCSYPQCVPSVLAVYLPPKVYPIEMPYRTARPELNS